MGAFPNPPVAARQESVSTLFDRQRSRGYGPGGRRAAILDRGLALWLYRYMRFRHLFPQTSGYELVWDGPWPLAEALPPSWPT